MSSKITVFKDSAKMREICERYHQKEKKKITVFKDSAKMREICERYHQKEKKKERLERIKDMITLDDKCRYHLVLYKDKYYDYLKDTKILTLKSKSIQKVLVKCNSEILGQFLFPMSLTTFQAMFKLIDKKDLINSTGYMYHTPEGIYDDMNHNTEIKSLSQLLTIYIEQEVFNYIGSEVLELDKDNPSFLTICFDKVNRILDKGTSQSLVKFISKYLNKEKDDVVAISLDREVGKWSNTSKWKMLSGPSLVYVKMLNIYILCNGDTLDELSLIDKRTNLFFDAKITANSFNRLSDLISSGRLDTSDSDDITSEMLLEMYNDSTIIRFGFNKKIKSVGDRLLLLFIVPMIYEYYELILEENRDEIEIYAYSQMEYLGDLVGYTIDDDEAFEGLAKGIKDGSMVDYYVNFFINTNKKKGPSYKEGLDLREMIILPVESKNISRMEDVKLSIRDLTGMKVTMSNGVISFKKKHKAVMIDDKIKIY